MMFSHHCHNTKNEIFNIISNDILIPYGLFGIFVSDVQYVIYDFKQF